MRKKEELKKTKKVDKAIKSLLKRSGGKTRAHKEVDYTI